MADEKKLIDFRHPVYSANVANWDKWRYIFEGGDCMVEKFVRRLSEREGVDDFRNRKAMTPAASFAKAAVTDIKNSIFQRITDVTRRGGSDKYEAAMAGLGLGVDLHGTSMNTYIGRDILPELLPMAKVGAYLDAPPLPGKSVADQKKLQPYLYTYRVEDILCWQYKKDDPAEFQSLLLRDWCDDCDRDTGLPHGTWCRYRYVYLENNQVHIQFYDEDCNCCDCDGEQGLTAGEIVINIPRIPFAVAELTQSLLMDASNYQIALVNLESTDVSYAHKALFAFYVEQQDVLAQSQYLEKPGENGEAGEAGAGKSNEMKVGAMMGRFYAKGLNQPDFIAPPSEPLMASMAKQKAMKEDIRQLVNLSLAQVQSKMASAESKSLDERGLEAGLSYIGLELERFERRIASFWEMYENPKRTDSKIIVQYPRKYSLQSDSDRREDVKQLEDLRDSIPSEKFQKRVSKEMVQTLLGHRMTADELDAIFAQIDSAKCFTANPDTIFEALTAGAMPLEIAAELLGMPPDAVEKANKDHADRLKRIADSQPEKPEPGSDPGARGVTDLSGNPKAGAADEKKKSRENTTDDKPTKKVRGEGK